MPITEEQLAAIKAANHAKSKAWEEERFLTGDRVVLYQRYYAKRLATNSWLDEQSNTEFETLSRWLRHILNRPSESIKRHAIMLAYPGVRQGTYKLIEHLPTKDKREPHMLPAVAAQKVETPLVNPAPASLPKEEIVPKVETPPVNLVSLPPPQALAPVLVSLPKEEIVPKVETPPVNQLSEEKIRDVVEKMINWLNTKDMACSLLSAGLGELVDFLVANKENAIALMRKNIVWHLTLSANITALKDRIIDSQLGYDDVSCENADIYYDNFTFY